MENAFWDSIAEDLMKVPTGYKRIVSLVGEVRDELEVLVPEEWKMELHESMDLELFSQVQAHHLLCILVLSSRCFFARTMFFTGGRN
jgi:hypothetical protein